MALIFSLVIAYLLGSISFSYFIGKKVANIDIRKHGSGNAGATNTLRVLGKGPAILVLVLDALKAVVAMLITNWITGGDPLAYALAGIFAIVGHNWPIFFGFRGGKGIATAIGVVIAISPSAFIAAAILAVVAIAITRYVSLGSLIFVTAVPLGFVYFDVHPATIWVSLLITIFAYVRHYQNIINLIHGKERKLGDQSGRNLR